MRGGVHIVIALAFECASHHRYTCTITNNKGGSRSGSVRVVGDFTLSCHTKDTVAMAPLDPCAYEINTQRECEHTINTQQDAQPGMPVFMIFVP